MTCDHDWQYTDLDGARGQYMKRNCADCRRREVQVWVVDPNLWFCADCQDFQPISHQHWPQGLGG